MLGMEKHPLHMKNPELQTSPEVKRAVSRKEKESGESIPNDPSNRIEAYAERLENIFLNEDQETRKRNLELFRSKIYDSLIIKEENFPESYFELQQKIARERGQAVEVIPEETRNQMKEVAIQDQKASLDAWMDYLTSDDAVYPAWFKYYVWKNITKLSQFDKERGEYKKRTKTTVAPFPDIYREPLAQIADIYEKVKADNKNLKEPEIQDAFSKKFPDLYAELTQESLAAQMENKEELRGEWIKYEQGKDGEAEKLFTSLEGKGTGWCTAGQSTAKQQIETGDFYVYYSYDSNGEPTQPRLAIRMQGKDKIAEVRGVLPNQAVESSMQEILSNKLSEFGSEADVYQKKSADMQYLTLLCEKQEKGEVFSKEDLIFIYELNSPIEGFGYHKDPRVSELLSKRNPEEDAPTVFGCTEDQIAHNLDEIKENTKVYIGDWNFDIFKKIKDHPRIEHMYKRFPKDNIFLLDFETNLEIRNSGEAEYKLKERGIHNNVNTFRVALNRTEFSQNRETYNLVGFTPEELGIKEDLYFDKFIESCKELGLEMCPAEMGPYLAINYDGPDNVLVAMEPISVHPYEVIYYSRCIDGKRFLDVETCGGSKKVFRDFDKKFIFRYRK